MPKTAALTLTPAPNVARWLLNLATHPEAARWLLADTTRFASFFAALKPRIVVPETMEKALPDKSGKVKLRQELLEEWKKSDDQPFRGRMSPGYLEAFWEGTMLAGWAQREPASWEAALKQIVGQFAEEGPDEIGRPPPALSEFALALQDSPSLLAQTMPSVAREPVALFQLNMLLFCASARMFTSDERQIVELSFVLAEDEATRLFFELLAENPRAHAELMAVALNLEQDEWEALVSADGALAALHLVPFESSTRRVLPLHPFWHGWFGGLHKSGKEALERFLVPLTREKNAGALGRLTPDDTEMVKRILEPEQGRAGLPGRPGTNVLLYGAKSIDKLGWVCELAEEIGRVPYTLPAHLPEAVRPAVCYVAQRLLKRLDDKGLLVLSQSDTILTRTQRGSRQFMFFSMEFEDELPDTASEAGLINDNPVPSVWLVHSPDRLSENNIGRFLYTCEMKAASRAERRVEIQSVLGSLALSEAFYNELSQHTRVSEQQLQSAVELVRRLHGYPYLEGEAQSTREHLVRQAIEQSQKALDRRQKEDLRQPVTQYSLDLLNVHGAFTIPQILTSLRRQPNASLCFYGIPGTGKTQLAEHIAVELDKPILIKRASDILGKYVGENEKNIKLMFDEARDEDAVLLLDEADSFLRDRMLARQSWEISSVNELLQGMERHRGVFICTTNLFEQLDLASLRRFTFKLEFLALTEEQRWRMFLNEAGVVEDGLDPDQIEKWKMELALIHSLSPGDYATIQRQVRLMGEPLHPDRWIIALQSEAKAKMREARASMGSTERM